MIKMKEEKMTKKPSGKIYKDFNDWWQHGNHGWSSASIDLAKATWADFEPTITASRDDYTELMLREVRQMHERYVEHPADVTSYVKEHNLEALAGVRLFRWILDRKTGRTPRPDPQFYHYKGEDYAITGEAKVKNPADGSWVDAYQYVNRNASSTVFVREKKDFEAMFAKGLKK